MPVHLEVQDEIVMNREEADLHWELILKKCISIHTGYYPASRGYIFAVKTGVRKVATFRTPAQMGTN